MNRHFRTVAAVAFLLFTGWILAFKTLHVIGHTEHHAHACDHDHDDAPKEDAEACFVCDWTFALFDQAQDVPLPDDTELLLTGYAFGYHSPVAKDFRADTQNKAPPRC